MADADEDDLIIDGQRHPVTLAVVPALAKNLNDQAVDHSVVVLDTSPEDSVELVEGSFGANAGEGHIGLWGEDRYVEPDGRGGEVWYDDLMFTRVRAWYEVNPVDHRVKLSWPGGNMVFVFVATQPSAPAGTSEASS